MKKFFLLLLITLSTHAVMAGGRRIDTTQIIQPELLPTEAQNFIKQYTPQWRITKVTKTQNKEFTKYTVEFRGARITEFTHLGAFEAMQTDGRSMPVDFLPMAMRNYLKKNFPRRSIEKVSFNHDTQKWITVLDDKTIGTFDKMGFMIRIEM